MTTTTTDMYGPQTEQVLALVEKARTITSEQALQLWDAAWAAARDAARDAAWAAAWAAAWDAARDAARDAAWAAARDAARDAAWAAAWAAVALVVRDCLSEEHYLTLTQPWRAVMGPIHPDDAPLPA